MHVLTRGARSMPRLDMQDGRLNSPGDDMTHVCMRLLSDTLCLSLSRSLSMSCGLSVCGCPFGRGLMLPPGMRNKEYHVTTIHLRLGSVMLGLSGPVGNLMTIFGPALVDLPPL